MQPLGVDDAAEATNESCSLLLNLSVHPEVSHQVDVADPAGNGGQRLLLTLEQTAEICYFFLMLYFTCFRL